MPILSDIDADGYFSNSTASAYWLITRTGQLLGATTAFISTGRITMTVEGVIAAANTGIDLLSSATTSWNQASFIYVTVNGLVSGGGNFGQGIDYFMAGSELHNAGTVMGNYAVRFTDGEEAKVFNDGIVMGLLAAAALAIFLGLVAIAIRALSRARARRRQQAMASGVTAALAVSTASSMIAQNKTMAIAAALAIGAIAGTMIRSGRD